MKSVYFNSPITRSSTFNIHKLKMSIFSSQNVSRLVFILTARAESNILHAVNVESQTKWCPTMATRDKSKYGYKRKTRTMFQFHRISERTTKSKALFRRNRSHYLLLGGKSSRNTHSELPPQCCCKTITSHKRSSGNMSFFNCSFGPRNLIVTSAIDCS